MTGYHTTRQTEAAGIPDQLGEETERAGPCLVHSKFRLCIGALGCQVHRPFDAVLGNEHDDAVLAHLLARTAAHWVQGHCNAMRSGVLAGLQQHV